jgi:hypothetical protein
MPSISTPFLFWLLVFPTSDVSLSVKIGGHTYMKYHIFLEIEKGRP